MKKWNLVVWSVIVMSTLVGCGKSGENDPAMQANLSGKIAGREWALKFGTTTYVAEKKHWAIVLFNFDHQGDPCKLTHAPSTVYYAAFAIGELKAMELDAKKDSVDL